MGKLYLNFDRNWIEEKKLKNHTIFDLEKISLAKENEIDSSDFN